ncbi:MAG: hypothetical protein U9N46_07785 [Euryarchaeota archaeon]|nr:hypothetical protein [Euryarchaeota archaeon]
MSETLRTLGLIEIGVLAITEETIGQTVDELDRSVKNHNDGLCRMYGR